MKVLVLGANGQLGARCCALLVEAGHDVRGSGLSRAPAVLVAEGVERIVLPSVPPSCTSIWRSPGRRYR